ncbi:uncharacterized protein B0H18DRAFT_553754 [Fomitopsis serialis]|uniref:uncharacterized protein n=1 Tax=Fomitopsis serialis TaxID=139415 RepID=UPI002008E5D7|nr:uncharacterized protein B0H18DRAFT_553754 [Neoantrodia serialis]KAH9934313.1 hypothetical protein B0H18DRAFT_553754 [Neoantrodia serialis]
MTVASPSSHLSVNLAPTIGSMFIGPGIFSSMLYGFACAQLMYYLRNYTTKDRLPVKGLVLFVWLLDTTITVSDIRMIFYYLIQSHGRFAMILLIPKVFALEYATTVVTICVVQLFYVHEIWQLLQTLPRQSRVLISLIPAVISIIALGMSARPT